MSVAGADTRFERTKSTTPRQFYAYVSQTFEFYPPYFEVKAWGIWLQADQDVASGRQTMADFEGGKLPGEEPSQEIKDIWQLIYLFSNVPYQSAEYRAAGERACITGERMRARRPSAPRMPSLKRPSRACRRATGRGAVAT